MLGLHLVTNNRNKREGINPYAKAIGVNGNRGMVINLRKTDNVDFYNDEKSELSSDKESIIYEIHVRDFSINENSRIKYESIGKLIAFCEYRTILKGKYMGTGIDH